jgi:branched-chain amino acid transport system permease protein
VRLKGWIIAAVFPALCGGVEAWFSNVVDPDTAFSTLTTAKTIVYAVAGGLGSVTGPVVGAVVFSLIDEAIWRQFPALNFLILGLATVAFVLFLPRGLVGAVQNLKPAWRKYIP